ncbi:MAG: hypothetical protein SGPRY_014170, partial [Prymnesium sp.]
LLFRSLSIAGVLSRLLFALTPSLLVSLSRREPPQLSPDDASAITRATVALGPTAIKLGQAAANRPDIVGPLLADDLRRLHDSVDAFPTSLAREVIAADLPAERADALLAALPDSPVAAASLGQVYRLSLPSEGVLVDTAVKVLRPTALDLVSADEALARGLARVGEGLTSLQGERLLKPALVEGVDEFFSRMREEMDLAHEAENIEKFTELYGPGGRAGRRLRRRRGGGEILLPRVLPEWSGGRVLCMSWVEGEPLLQSGVATMKKSELPLLRFGIAATLDQMLGEGLMHADPHTGNLLRGKQPEAEGRGMWARWNKRPQERDPSVPRLAYLDFGLVSEVPISVREAIVCAVVLLLFERDVGGVASLFSDLMLLSPEQLSASLPQLQAALEALADSVLTPQAQGLPTLNFQSLIAQLALIAPQFAFQLPPYFLNNARALGTLEGMARSADPGFDILKASHSLKLLMWTLVRLTHDQDDKFDPRRVRRLVEETAKVLIATLPGL